MDAGKRRLMEKYKVIYTDSCKSQITFQLVFLKHKIGGTAAAVLIKTVLRNFEERVENYPESAQLCHELNSLGITKYRDYIDPRNNIRLLYTVNEQAQAVTVEAFLSTRQSITESLVNFCLVHE